MNTRHTPMVIDRAVFDKLFSFVEQFPHYFLGSNKVAQIFRPRRHDLRGD